jgi:hypothetical protein
MELVRFYSTVIWLGISLALVGQLKSCTRIMMGNAAETTRTGIMSYSNFSRELTRPQNKVSFRTQR